MKRIADQSLYEILDVRDDAPADEIAAACDRARALYGPGSLATYTLMSAEEAGLLTSRIDEARATLLDPGSRARYDEALAHGAGEPRATVGANGPATSLPPVIPAAPGPPLPLRTPAPGSLPAPTPPASPPQGEPPAVPAAAAPAGVAEPPAAPKPIRLEREISPAEAAARAQVPAPPPPVPAPVVPEGGAWSGDVLRQVREARGISVQQIAERTKVTRHHIENIEAERFGQLPAPVYLRGILLALARELRLDGQKVARSYLERAGAASASKGR